MKIISFALSILLQSSGTIASLRKPHQHLERDQAKNDKDHDVSHRIFKEATTVDSNSLIQYLESNQCAYLIDHINDTTEQFLNSNEDEEIIDYFCSDIAAGQILRKEAQMEKGLDAEAFIFTCESALDTLLVQQKESLFQTISDRDVCEAEVRLELDAFKMARRTLRNSSRQLGRYIIINKTVSNLAFLKRGMIIQKR